VWRCDTGMSSGMMSGPAECLEILPDGRTHVLTINVRMPLFPSLSLPLSLNRFRTFSLCRSLASSLLFLPLFLFLSPASHLWAGFVAFA
jgi:hypothetical protein